MNRISKHASVSPDVIVSSGVQLEVGDGTVIGPGVRIIGRGLVRFGDYCKVHSGCFVNAGDGGSVEFGHNCWFGERTVLDGTGHLCGGNNIGAGIASHLYTHIAHGDVIEGCKFQSKKEMVIEDDVWFVGQCLVSPIRAGAKSMAMLGSVITKDMEPNHVYAGTPAKDITDKTGAPWINVPVVAKFDLMRSRVDEYCSMIEPDFSVDVRDCIVPCIGYPIELKPSVTYFNVATRRYTKRSTQAERAFLSWLTSYKGRFTPEDQ